MEGIDNISVFIVIDTASYCFKLHQNFLGANSVIPFIVLRATFPPAFSSPVSSFTTSVPSFSSPIPSFSSSAPSFTTSVPSFTRTAIVVGKRTRV